MILVYHLNSIQRPILYCNGRTKAEIVVLAIEEAPIGKFSQSRPQPQFQALGHFSYLNLRFLFT